MHLTLDSDVGVSDGGGKELSESTQEEGNARGDLAPLLDRILHLLKKSVLKNGVDDQHESWDDTREEGLRSLILEKGQQRAQCAGGLRRSTGLGVGLLCTGGDPGVDDPDRVCDNDGGRSSKGTSKHGLNGSELLASASGIGCGLLEEGSGPFVPVVVDEVGDADAEERRVNSGVET